VRSTAWRAPDGSNGATGQRSREREALMEVLIVILALLLLAVVTVVISAPLRASWRDLDRASPERGELETAREAKYREIRDAELDFRTGKLSREDYQAVDGALRAEALEILNRLQEAERGEPEG
jgi:type II secretory pathway component PulM